MQCVDDQTLASMSLGLLSADDAASVREHAAQCSFCARRLMEVMWENKTVEEHMNTPAVGPPRDPDLLNPGERLGRYLVLEQLGVGGMGSVYAAYDPELDRKIALKVLRTHLLDGDGSQSRVRLLREAQAIARISHPNVVAVFDVGTVESRVFVAMEFVDGGTLRQWLKQKSRSWKEIVDAYRAAARGLAAAHAAGLVHRDFKPDNVLVGKDGRIRVTDFGLARLISSTDEDHPVVLPLDEPMDEASRPLSSQVTRQGTILGTPGYMAPEQFRGAPDSRSDQFAFCVALYESLYGKRPYLPRQLASDPTAAVLPPPPKDANVPLWIHKVLARGLSIAPGQRFAAMNDLVRSLHRDPVVLHRRWLTWAALALLLGAVVLGAQRLRLQSGQRCVGAEQRLAGIWDDDARQRIKAAFSKVGTSLATTTWEIVDRALNDYAVSWTAMRTETCRATRLRGEQSEAVMTLRLDCLDRRLHEVQALSELFARADAIVVENAARAVHSLAPLTKCADLKALTTGVPPPSDPATRAKIEETERQIASARSLFQLAKNSDALEAARTAAANASGLHYPPLEAKALALLGQVQAKVGRFKEAQATLHNAMVTAEAGGDDGIKADAMEVLGWVFADQLRQADEGLRWSELAEATVQRMGGDPLRLSSILIDRASYRRHVGKLTESVQIAERGLALIGEPVSDPGSQLQQTILRAKGLMTVGSGYLKLGQYQTAIDYYARAHREWETAYGPEHPDVLVPLYNMGIALRELGRTDEAYQKVEHSVRLWEQVLGKRHPRLVAGYATLSRVQRSRGDVAGAVWYAKKAVDLGKEVLGLSNLLTTEASIALGKALQSGGQSAQALAVHRQAVAILETSREANPISLADALQGEGEAVLSLGRPTEAVPLLERAVALRAKAEGDPMDFRRAGFALARALWDSSQSRARAVLLAREARETFAGQASTAKDFKQVDKWMAQHPLVPSQPKTAVVVPQ